MGSLLWLPLEYLVLQQAISIYFLERRWEDSFFFAHLGQPCPHVRLTTEAWILNMLTVKGGQLMDQLKVGAFLKTLRKEKNLTQE